MCSYCAKGINTSFSLSLCLGDYLKLQLQNGVQMHVQPLLISEKGRHQSPFKLWGFFTPVGTQTCPVIIPLGAWGNMGQKKGQITPSPESLSDEVHQK